MHLCWGNNQSQNFSVLRTTFAHTIRSLKVSRMQNGSAPQIHSRIQADGVAATSNASGCHPRGWKMPNGVLHLHSNDLAWKSYVSLLLTISSFTKMSHMAPIDHKGSRKYNATMSRSRENQKHAVNNILWHTINQYSSRTYFLEAIWLSATGGLIIYITDSLCQTLIWFYFFCCY